MLEYDLIDGTRVNLVENAISILQHFEPEEGFYLAFSGGKDSVVCKKLLDMSGCKYDAHYNPTTVDPPELMQFIRKEYPDVIWERPKKSMRTLIVEKKMPPTGIVRYCCAELKEGGGMGRRVVTGVRWEESIRRKNNQGLVTIMRPGKRLTSQAEQIMGDDLKVSKKGGLVLNFDNEQSRQLVDICYRTRKTLINPIVDWTSDNVWEFIRRERVPYCSLYDEGWSRIGCICCPMGSTTQRLKEAERWPQYKRMYIKAFDAMIAKRKENGLRTGWKTGEEVWDWWVNGNTKRKVESDGQIGFDDLFDGEEKEDD